MQLIVYPKVLSSGRQLFRSGTDAALELIESKAFSSGPVLLTYAVAQEGSRDRARLALTSPRGGDRFGVVSPLRVMPRIGGRTTEREESAVADGRLFASPADPGRWERSAPLVQGSGEVPVRGAGGVELRL